MKQGLTLEQLAGRLHEEQAMKHDFIAPTRQIHFNGGNDEAVELVLNGQGVYVPTENFHRQTAKTLGIPKAYYDRMREMKPGLLKANVNSWLGDKDEMKMVRTLGPSARALMSDRFRPLDNIDLANRALPLLSPLDCEVQSCDLSPEFMHLKVTTPKIEAEVRKGDIVQVGLVISNSEIGLGSVRVEPLVFRLACLNGMIMQDYAFRKYHVWRALSKDEIDTDRAHEFLRDETRIQMDEAFWMQFEDLLSGVLDMEFFEDYINKIRESTDRKIEKSPVQVVEYTANRLELSEEDHGNVLKYLVDGGDLTQWGLANALTRASQDTDTYAQATTLERAGGEIVELGQEVWNNLAGKK